MNSILNYYILPLQVSFRYVDVIDSLKEELKKLSNSSIEFDIHLVDNFIGGGPIPIDVNSHFAWRSPEVESLVIDFKRKDLPNQSLTIDCNFLHPSFVIEDIAEDSGILNEDQLANVQDDGYWYWSFSIVENKIEQAASSKLTCHGN